MQKVAVLFIILSVPLVGYAQEFKTISGEVIDKASNEPIPFCTVYILGESVGTITNQDGQYQLNIPLKYWNDTLTVSHVGYQNFYGMVSELPSQLYIELNTATVNLEEVLVTTKKLTATEVFLRAIDKIKENNGYETTDFRMDGFFREIHTSQAERTGVLECAVEIYDNRVTNNFKNIVIPQFRKVYERRKNQDQFIKTKEGHNHLLLIMNDGINLVPLGKKYKSSIWQLPLEIEKITYYNDRLVYVLSNKVYGRTLRLLVDVADYSVYKNELILEVDEEDHEHYAWQQVNTNGEKCGAMIDHQGYEYRKVNGKLFPHYFFRRMDFRCYNLSKEQISSEAYLSKELLINNIEVGVAKAEGNKLKAKQGMINRKAPYDSAFWKYFNDIRDIEVGDQLNQESPKVINKPRHLKLEGVVSDAETEKPLELAHVSILGTSKGIVTNKAGQFELYIPSALLTDTLKISHIGFKPYLVKLSDIESRRSMTISLEQEAYVLPEFEVSSLDQDPRLLVKKSILNIGNVFPNEEFLLKGFYRTWFINTQEEDSINASIAEAAVTVYDKGYKKKGVSAKREKVVIDEVRTIEYPDFEGQSMAFLFLQNPVRYQKQKANIAIPGVLDLSNDLHYEIDEILLDENAEKTYKISALDERHHATYKLYISARDLAILQIDLKAKAPVGHYVHQNVEDTTQRMMWIDNTVRFKRFNKIPYLSYIRQHWYWEMVDSSGDSVTQTGEFFTEFATNEIFTDKKSIAKAKSKSTSTSRPLYERNKPYNKKFWDSFNTVKLNPLNNRLRSALVKSGRSIENRFLEALREKEDDLSRTLKLGNHGEYLFSRADSLYGELTPNLSCYDVTHYDLKIEIDSENEWISGTSEITFRMVEAADRIRIDLFEYLKINSISFQDQPLSFTRDLDAVYVEFPETLEKDQMHAIQVEYEGHPLEPDFVIWASGFLWDEDSEGAPFSQSLCQGYGAKAWWPVKNHLSDEPDSADIRITVPKELMAVSNGTLVSTCTKAEKVTYHWKVSYPINNYNVAAHIGNYTFHIDSLNTLPISYYYLKQDSVLATEKLQIVPKMLEIYEKYFGPYPFPDDGFKIVQTPHPMEHQSCVAIGKHFSDQLILHESAHEWWGNNLSIKDNADIWIHEAFATYAESLYIEETLGYEIGQEYLNAKKDAIHNDYPLVGAYGVNHFHYRIEDKYFKGALILNTLRHLVDDDDLWVAALKGIQTDFRYSFIDTEQITTYFIEKLKKDYSAFFDQYLTTVDIPFLEVKTSNNGSIYRLTNVVDNLSLQLKANELELDANNEWKSAQKISNDDINLLELKYLIKVIN